MEQGDKDQYLEPALRVSRLETRSLAAEAAEVEVCCAHLCCASCNADFVNKHGCCAAIQESAWFEVLRPQQSVLS